MATYLDQILHGLTVRAERYDLFRRYYNGQHNLAYATDKFRNAFGNVLRAFADNLCPTVVDAVADRLEITEFCVEELEGETLDDLDLEEGSVEAEALAKKRKMFDRLASRIWKRNRMDQRAGEVHQEALTEGDAYVIVWPDQGDGFPCIYVERADCITVRYDREQPNQLLWAAKVWWQDDRRIRLTAYFPDRIEKYVTLKPCDKLPDKIDDFIQLVLPDEPWPLPNPYDRVPVFHFANNSGIGQFGRSELVDVIPLQDGLNKSTLDLFVAMEFVALPQRYITGLEVEIDELTGKPKIPFQVGVDRIWTLGNEEARFGEFAGADLSAFINVQNSFREEIARVTGTPLHYFLMMKDPPSGVALRALEARLIKRVKDRQVSFGNTWEDVMAFCLLILGNDNVRYKSFWVPAELQDPKEQAETLLLKKELGVSQDQCLREAGYTDEQIDQMEQESLEKQETFGSQLLNEFDRGNTAPGDRGGDGSPNENGGRRGNNNADQGE